METGTGSPLTVQNKSSNICLMIILIPWRPEHRHTLGLFCIRTVTLLSAWTGSTTLRHGSSRQASFLTAHYTSHLIGFHGSPWTLLINVRITARCISSTLPENSKTKQRQRAPGTIFLQTKSHRHGPGMTFVLVWMWMYAQVREKM